MLILEAVYPEVSVIVNIVEDPALGLSVRRLQDSSLVQNDTTAGNT